ncbi:ABC transporter substrate-binding protein [Streptomyces sulphureus]|uniref:ABC transporter substrate-binding protein n=1 Tax=Streptomyces sulphureus TaxID=47758 RepID=UPI00035FFD03|nr:ABC transporter substrate-binding protein [Streptomyces sulphureus]
MEKTPLSRLSRRAVLSRGAGGAAALAVGGLLTGCGNDGTPAAEESYSGKPRKGGRLRAAFAGGSAESTSVVQATATVVDYVRARIVWDTLGELEGNKPVWRLAESVEHNADATQWTIRVRKGVRFSDGAQLDAHDVLFSLRTIAKHPGGQAALLANADLAKARVRHDRTLVLPLKQPDGSFDLALAQSMFIFPDGTENLNKAPGTGPFVLKKWSPGKSSLLEANKEYWDADSGGPYLDEVELFSVGDAAARLSGLKSGQFDYAGGVSLATARAEKANERLRILLPPKELWTELAFAMNLDVPPFTSAALAEAVKYAIDREAMVKTVTLGFGEAAHDARGMHQPWYADDLPAREHDPDRAKALLKKAGLGGKGVTLRTAAVAYGTVESASAFVQQAEAADLRVELDKVPAADYYGDTDKLLHTPIQSAAYSPMPLPLELSNYYGSNASYPFTGKAPRRLESLLDDMRRAVSETDRKRAVSDVQHYLHEKGGDAVFARLPSAAAATPEAQGVKALGWAEYPSLRDAFLAP